MVERATIINPFFRELFDEIAPEIDRCMVLLASGGSKRVEGGIETTGEAYAAACATIAAYNEVLKICSNIEHNIHGNRPEEQQPQS